MKQLQASINSHEHEQVVAFKDLEFSDPAHWPSVLSDEHTKFIVEKGPCHIKNYDYPTDKNGRRFLERYYDRHLANSETVNRVWLVYSPSTDSVLCFCCKLFRSNEKIALVTEGFCDWKNIASRLSEHEVSRKHLECMQNWRSLEVRLFSHTTIDETNERLILKFGGIGKIIPGFDIINLPRYTGISSFLHIKSRV